MLCARVWRASLLTRKQNEILSINRKIVCVVIFAACFNGTWSSSALHVLYIEDIVKRITVKQQFTDRDIFCSREVILNNNQTLSRIKTLSVYDSFSIFSDHFSSFFALCIHICCYCLVVVCCAYFVILFNLLNSCAVGVMHWNFVFIVFLWFPLEFANISTSHTFMILIAISTLRMLAYAKANMIFKNFD